MEIIKKNELEKIHKCRKCKSVFTYMPNDVYWDIYPTIRCPVCKLEDGWLILDKRVKKVKEE